ncbi:MAG: LytTR family DNA-binding domain-containing protein [Paracoccaceae bacterium]
MIARPFGMYFVEGYVLHLAFWVCVISISSFLGHVANGIAEAYCGTGRPLCADIMMTFLVTLFFAPILRVLVNEMVASPDNPMTWSQAGSYVFGITVVICMFRRMLPGLTQSPYLASAPSAEPEPELSNVEPTSQPRLKRRLPESCQGHILRLTVRDHCVDVITPQATHTLRMRFGDAVEEMEPVEGFCTHRSHWVSREAIDCIDRDDGKIYVRLVNGDRIPVSRKFRPELETAGVAEATPAPA